MLPVVEALAAEVGVPISIDTSKAAVAQRALEAGAAMINDVTALRSDPEMPRIAAEAGVPVVLMHMLGSPRMMQEDPRYDDLMGEIIAYLRGSIAVAVDAGVPGDQLVVDPGIGFGKTLEHNLEIIRRLPQLRSLGSWILVGSGFGLFLFGSTLLAREGVLGGTEWGIILVDEVAVQSAPSQEDDLTLFHLHEGTKVRLDQHTEEWSEVVLEDGRVGWVPSGVLEGI